MKLFVFMLISGLIGNAGGALAQTWPTGSLTLVVAAPPGGQTDIYARTIAEPLSRAVGQPVKVENRPGEDGGLAAAVVLRAPSDGNTLLVARQSQLQVNPMFNRNLAWKPSDFALVIKGVEEPLALVANPGVQARSAPEFIQWAKANRGRVLFSFSDTALPSLGELLAKHLNQSYDLGMTGLRTPGGSAGQVQSVVEGQAQVSFVPVPFMKRDGLRPLAVTGSERWRGAPDIPTMTQWGLPEFTVANWTGIATHARTPPAVMARIAEAVLKAHADASVRASLLNLGLDVPAQAGRDLELSLKQSADQWSRIAGVPSQAPVAAVGPTAGAQAGHTGTSSTWADPQSNTRQAAAPHASSTTSSSAAAGGWASLFEQGYAIPPPAIVEYASRHVFEIVDPVPCMVPVNGPNDSRELHNTCDFEVEVVYCSDQRVSCNSSTEALLGSGGLRRVKATGPNFGYTLSANGPPARSVSAIACPADPQRGHPGYEGHYFNVFKVDRAGQNLVAKCLRRVTASVSASDVRTVHWPLYKGNLVLRVTGPWARALPALEPQQANLAPVLSNPEWIHHQVQSNCFVLMERPPNFIRLRDVRWTGGCDKGLASGAGELTYGIFDIGEIAPGLKGRDRRRGRMVNGLWEGPVQVIGDNGSVVDTFQYRGGKGL